MVVQRGVPYRQQASFTREDRRTLPSENYRGMGICSGEGRSGENMLSLWDDIIADASAATQKGHFQGLKQYTNEMPMLGNIGEAKERLNIPGQRDG